MKKGVISTRAWRVLTPQATRFRGLIQAGGNGGDGAPTIAQCVLSAHWETLRALGHFRPLRESMGAQARANYPLVSISYPILTPFSVRYGSTSSRVSQNGLRLSARPPVAMTTGFFVAHSFFIRRTSPSIESAAP